MGKVDLTLVKMWGKSILTQILTVLDVMVLENMNLSEDRNKATVIVV
jgi:hypothetical protein